MKNWSIKYFRGTSRQARVGAEERKDPGVITISLTNIHTLTGLMSDIRVPVTITIMF